MTTASDDITTALTTRDHVGALQILKQDPEKSGLPAKQAADHLDQIIADIGEDKDARALIDAHLTPDRIVELARGRGDLPSAMKGLLTTREVIAALVGDYEENMLGEATDEAMALTMVQAWALDAMDRPDYAEILIHHVTPQVTILDLLVRSLQADTDGQVFADELARFNLDPHISIDAIEEPDTPLPTQASMERAKKVRADTRNAAEAELAGDAQDMAGDEDDEDDTLI